MRGTAPPGILRPAGALGLALVTLGAAGAGFGFRFEAGPRLDFRHLSGEPEKRYILETMGSGVALFDYDGDGDLDVYLVTASTLERIAAGAPGDPNRLYRNDGRGGFADVTEQAGVGHTGFGQGVAVADIDNDGDEDLYVTNYGPNVLYENNGDGTFTERAGEAADEGWGASAAFADVDADGLVDLYVANYLVFDRELLDRLVPRRFCLWKGIEVNCGPRGFGFASGVLYRNRGAAGLVDATAEAGVERRDTYQLGVVFSDLDRDGDVDLYVATDSTMNLLFANRGDGRFEDVSLASGAALSQLGAEQAGMGVDAGDVDGDGLADLFVTNFSDDYNTLYRNLGGLRFVDATDVAGLAAESLSYLGWTTRLVDLDADADLDLFLVNGHVYPQVDGAGLGESFRQPWQVFANRGDGVFAAVPMEVLAVPRAGRGGALGDLDGDGVVDAVVQVIDDAPLVLLGRDEGRGRSLRLALVGRRANRNALGAEVVAVVDGRTIVREVRAQAGYLSSGDRRVEIGLGRAGRAEAVRIRWPGGGEDRLVDLEPGSYTVVEGVGVVP